MLVVVNPLIGFSIHVVNKVIGSVINESPKGVL